MASHSTADHVMEDQQTEESTAPSVLNQSSTAYNEELDRKQFTSEIHKFMSEIGKPLSKIPIMGYKELDLFQLYREVIAHGGFNEVVKNVGTWSKIWKRLGNFDPSITDSSFRLKKNYERYLLEYEYKSFPDHRLQADLDKSTMKRSSSAQNLSRPHSPTQFSSNTSSASSPHNSPEFGRKNTKASKASKKVKTPRRTPSRSNSFNSLYIPQTLNSVKLPLVLDDLTIESLGNIVPRYPYVIDGQIWPIGFTSHRLFNSRVNPGKQVRYTSQILDAGDRPQFVVTAADDLAHPIVSFDSPSACWKAILQSIVEADESNTISNSQKLSVSGRLRFGLTHPEVASLIRELPNAAQAELLQGSMSPSKRKYQSDDSSDELQRTKVQRYGTRSWSQHEADDLESAIATLQALKYSSF